MKTNNKLFWICTKKYKFFQSFEMKYVHCTTVHSSTITVCKLLHIKQPLTKLNIHNQAHTDYRTQ